ncbi:MAG: hypothetical protein JO016_05640 [Actinobacteria bacterium]|nr:hypothetical protein [Actinomycetota bacterium]
MSIATMVDTRIARQQAENINSPSPDKPVGAPTDLVNQITRWIPTETITIYVALLALLAPVARHAPTYQSRWVLLGIVAASNPVVVYLLTKAKTQTKKIQMPWFEMMVAPVAFAAWAFALPDTPLSSIPGYQLKWNAAIVTVTTTAIVLIANALHNSPDYDQVVTIQQGAQSEHPIDMSVPAVAPRTAPSTSPKTPAAVTGS